MVGSTVADMYAADNQPQSQRTHVPRSLTPQGIAVCICRYKKKKFRNKFDLVCLSNMAAHHMKDAEFPSLLTPRAAVIVETARCVAEMAQQA